MLVHFILLHILKILNSVVYVCSEYMHLQNWKMEKMNDEDSRDHS